jgi:hypothetical protein
MTWNDQFLALFRFCLQQYQSGNQEFLSYYQQDDLDFLNSIGYKPRELFDFVEDFSDDGMPTESTALLVASVRRDYFQHVQEGVQSNTEITADDIPSRSDEYQGLACLPRIVAKAEAKLRGELHPNLMFGCGGDRGFLRSNGNIHLADFLRHVWAANGDISSVHEFVKLNS